MAWTYDPAMLATVPLYQVRLRIGDIYESKPLFQDEELQTLLDLNDDDISATSLVAVRALRVRAAREVDKWVGDLKILASQRARAYKELEEQLEATEGAFAGKPYAGGIRVSDKEATEENDDLVKPSFRRDLHDYQEP